MMKNAMKIGVAVIVVLFTLQANAQTFGLRAGLSLPTILEKDDYDTYSDEYSLKPSFHAGVTFEQPISDILSFETGLMLETKGTLYKEEDYGYTLKVKTNPLYLSIPLTLKGTYAFTENVAMWGVIGPYIGLGVGGKVVAELSGNGDKSIEKEEIPWGSDSDDLYKRFDAGLVFGAGVDLSGIQIGIFYELGLANVAAVQDGGYTIKNRVLKFSVEYKFGEGGGERYPW